MTIQLKILALLLGVIILSPIAAFADADKPKSKINDEWHFELKPLYLWFLSLEGDTTMPVSGGSSDGTSTAPRKFVHRFYITKTLP